MNKITATVYETFDPSEKAITSTALVDAAWTTRDSEVWANNVKDLITPDAVILDAGGGVGRLLPRLWEAKRIVLVEPDRKRFAHASVVAQSLIDENQQLLEKLENYDFLGTEEYENLLKQAHLSPVKSEKVCLLNDVMQSPAIAAQGQFDLIVCSHIFEHITLDIIQESIAAFYNFLKPNGSLVIFACKSPVLYHFRCDKEFNYKNILITRKEFADIFKNGYSTGLGVRYMPFDLLQTIIANPFNPSLQEVFDDEFKFESEHYQLPEQPLFTIKQWEAYHSEFYIHENMKTGEYIEYPQIQARLSQPVKPIETVAEILELEHQVNQNETLKKMHLIDMVVVAQKNS